MIVDMLSNKKRNPIVAELFIRVKKVNIYIVLILLCQNALFCYENSKQKRTWTYLVSSFISYLLSRLYEYLQEITPKPYSFLVIDATIAQDKPLHFKKNLIECI